MQQHGKQVRESAAHSLAMSVRTPARQVRRGAALSDLEAKIAGRIRVIDYTATLACKWQCGAAPA